MILPGAGGLALGVALVWIGVQRARFRTGGHGPGLVQVDEGQITYLGPMGGGMIAVQDISRICLDRASPRPHWRLERAQGADVAVPVDAEGADALFDAFAQLPDLSLERLIAALHGHPQGAQNGPLHGPPHEPGAGLAVVWQRRRPNAALR
jgi:phytoene dehydrogenase-like protein